MGAVPNSFLSASPYVASFDWIDFTSGAGYKRFYANMFQLSGSTVYAITTEPIDAVYGTGTSFYITAAQNFEMTFGTPAIIEGDFLSQFTAWSTANKDVKVTMTIYHVRGAVATQIGTAITTNLQTSVDAYWRMNIKAALTRTKFAIGDILRVTVTPASTNGGSVRLAVDPTSRMGLTEATSAKSINSDCSFFIPFVINI